MLGFRRAAPTNVAFYMNNHWEMVPEEWRASLLTLTDDELKVGAARLRGVHTQPAEYVRF